MGTRATKPVTRPRKYALLIGINYLGTTSQLTECVNDVAKVRKILIDKYKFGASNITLLNDHTFAKPTRQNILSEMQKLAQKAKTDDIIYIHYSGHGSRLVDRSGDEADGYDEVIVPLDFERSACISDDEIRRILCAAFTAGVKVRIVLDCCHSGTACDLKYVLDEGANIIESKYAETAADVILISGCRDAQVSLEDQSGGMLTTSYLETL